MTGSWRPRGVGARGEWARDGPLTGLGAGRPDPARQCQTRDRHRSAWTIALWSMNCNLGTRPRSFVRIVCLGLTAGSGPRSFVRIVCLGLTAGSGPRLFVATTGKCPDARKRAPTGARFSSIPGRFSRRACRGGGRPWRHRGRPCALPWRRRGRPSQLHGRPGARPWRRRGWPWRLPVPLDPWRQR